MRLEKKKAIVQKRRWRIRKKIVGTKACPRVTVHFSHQHIYAQAIDDVTGTVICAVNTLQKDFKDSKLGPNIEGATSMGETFAKATAKQGVSKIVFDRNGRRYHGCVKAFADAARSAGLKF